MRRRVFLPTLLLIAVFALTSLPASAETITWTGGYPQQNADGCIEYVAAWSDGTYTSTPWNCPADAGVRAATATGAEARRAPNGCTEYVTRWDDGSITWVPFACPAGVGYPKPSARQLAPESLPEVAPIPPSPAPPGLATFNPFPYSRYGNRYDCGDFENQAMAQAVLRADPSDPNRLDEDGNGVACESTAAPTDLRPVEPAGLVGDS